MNSNVNKLQENKFKHGTFKTYYNSSCSVCLKNGTDTKRCCRCKAVAYCSKKHQKQDWMVHRNLCKAIAETNEIIQLIPNSSYDEYLSYRLSLKFAWESIIKRKLKPWEELIWMFPRVCEICYTKLNLKDCEKCWCVAYCSEEHLLEHQATHKKFCDALKLCFDLDCFLLEYNSTPQFSLDVNKDIDILKHDQFLVSNQHLNSKIQENLIVTLKREAISPISVIIYVLQSVNLLKDLKSHLIVHIVGSSEYELGTDWGLNGEILLHWAKDLTAIYFILVGPEAEGDIVPVIIINKSCKTCVTNERFVSIEYHKKLYHDVAFRLSQPDLIVLFNSGIHEFDQKNDTWSNSFPSLFKHVNVPVCFTSYTEKEMQLDIERLRSVVNDVQFLVKNRKNPIGNERPYRNWLDTTNSPVFYFNSYISIAKKI